MGHSSIRLKVRRRKVAHLAARGRQFSVRNCTVPPANKEDIIDIKYEWGTVKGTKGGSWNIPKEGYPQVKSLHKRIKGIKFEWNHSEKDGVVIDYHAPIKFDYPSEYPNLQEYQKKLWKNLGKAAKMELYVQDKLKKWEKKHPKPCPDDDLFKDEMIPAWEHEKEQALIHIRDFVVSMFDKLPLVGRFKTGAAVYQEKLVAELKDHNGEGHKVNDLEKNSKLLKKAQKVTNKVHAKHANLVCTNLGDHKRKHGRIILPKAA